MTLRLLKGDRIISSWEHWRDHAPPKGKERQWEPGRSAWELARAWCAPNRSPAPPVEFLTLLQRNPAFSSILILEGFPEDRIAFDRYGEPRNADLNLRAQVGNQVIAISVEGKADESFGRSVRAALAAAKKRRADGKASNAPARIRQLAKALFPASIVGRKEYEDLPNQLLTGTAGALALAKRWGAHTAVFVIHEFVGGQRRDGTEATRPANVKRNGEALNRFLTALSGTPTSITHDQIVGPYRVPGNAYLPSDVVLYVGKTRRNLALR